MVAHLVERIEALGLVAEIFHDPRGTLTRVYPFAQLRADAQNRAHPLPTAAKA